MYQHTVKLIRTAPGLFRRTDVGESDHPIPLPNVSSNVLKKVS